MSAPNSGLTIHTLVLTVDSFSCNCNSIDRSLSKGLQEHFSLSSSYCCVCINTSVFSNVNQFQFVQQCILISTRINSSMYIHLHLFHSKHIQYSTVFWVLLCEKIVVGWMVRDLLPFQGSSEALLYFVRQASPWWHWPLMDLGGLCACQNHIQRTWQSCSWLHTSSCSVPVHVPLWPSWTCVVSCHVLHHPYHVWWYHLWFWWLLHSNLGSDPSFSGRYPMHKQVLMEDIQSEISLYVCWRLSEEMIHSWELCNSEMKMHPLWWFSYYQLAHGWFLLVLVSCSGPVW